MMMKRRRRRTAAAAGGEERALFFFVLSHTLPREDREMLTAKASKARVALHSEFPSASSGAQQSLFFVQNWSDAEDDGRLGEVRERGGTVVNAAYCARCLDAGRCLPAEALAIECESAAARTAAENALRLLWDNGGGCWPRAEEGVREWQELPQTAREFEEDASRLRPGKGDAHTRIRVVALGGGDTESISATVASFLEAFFVGLRAEVVRGPLLLLAKGVRRSRGRLNALALIDKLQQLQTPSDEETLLLTVGIVEEDIYEDARSADPLMGRATGDGACVVSLHHFLHRRRAATEPLLSMERGPLLQDFLGTVLHEVLHVLGFDHCAYNACVMNACAACEPDLLGTTASFLLPCPVCIAKLALSLGSHSPFQFERWRSSLAAFIRTHSLVVGEAI